MPRIHDRFLECAIYLYPDKQEADKCTVAGGSGFLVGIPARSNWLTFGSCPSRFRHHVYAVTNRHVIDGEPDSGDDKKTPKALPSPTIRLNLKDGTSRTITDGEWFKSEMYDLAFKPISWDENFQAIFISIHDFLVSEEDAKNKYIGIGDDVFMVSRFVGNDMTTYNEPIVRWGNMSSRLVRDLPTDRIDSGKQDSFLVEVHSISGYSGSPVFVRPFEVRIVDPTIVSEQDLQDNFGNTASSQTMTYPKNPSKITTLKPGPWLLGIQWGNFTLGETMPLRADKDDEGTRGISCVVPAWYLYDLLMKDTNIVKQRRSEQETLARQFNRARIVNSGDDRHQPDPDNGI
jgi:hypothetical protein